MNTKVKDIMIPLAQYATVSEEATLYEAVMALEEAQQKFDQKFYRHRAVLVFDSDGRIVGKLSQLDILRGLEPKYENIGDFKAVTRFGFSPEYIKSMMKDQGLWDKPLDDICKKAARIQIKEIMYTPAKDEYVEQDVTLNEAIHRLVMGHHQSLLVTGDRGKIVGILRLTDVFKEICERMKACGL